MAVTNRLSRRSINELLFSTIALGSLGALGCQKQASGPVVPRFQPTAVGADTAPRISVFMPASSDLWPFWESFSAELEEDFRLEPKVIDTPTPADFMPTIESNAPHALILADNRIVRAYRDFQRSRPAETHPPSIVLLSSFAGELVQGLQNSTGISYEVPVATSISVLRDVVTQDIGRVGVLYRKGLRDFVARQYSFAKDERFELVGVELSKAPGAVEIRKGLRHLLQQQSVDALWILNDNALLQPDYLRDAWLPVLDKHRVPTVVGVSSLLSERIGFATLAIEPELEGLGLQAANRVFDLEEDGWSLASNAVDFPLSTRATLDAASAKKHFGLRPDRLTEVSLL